MWVPFLLIGLILAIASSEQTSAPDHAVDPIKLSRDFSPGPKYQSERLASQPELLPNEETDDSSSPDNNPCLPALMIEQSRSISNRFAESGVLSKQDFSRLLEKIGSGLKNLGGIDLLHHCDNEEHTYVEVDGRRVNCTDIITECVDLDGIYARHSTEEGLNASSLSAAIQDSVFLLTNPNCVIEYSHRGQKPPVAKVWMYGMGFVVCLLILSNLGGLLTPLMSQNFFKRLLQFLVSLGAGTLVATAVFVLIPEAFDIVSVDELADDYIWKATAILLTIYCFFVAEQLLKFGIKAREVARPPPERLESYIIGTPTTDKKALHFGINDNDEEKALALLSNNGNTFSATGDRAGIPLEYGHSHFPANIIDDEQNVSSVAWVLMMGDVIHKVVDGVAIGAALTENLALGVTIAISVLFEEFPHELGDIAILIHSGIKMRKALFINSLTASASFVGLTMGILLGENTSSTRWVLAVASGVFLYAPLADMLPEMSQHLEIKMVESRNRVTKEVWILVACQSFGLLIGMALIFVVANFASMIEIDS